MAVDCSGTTLCDEQSVRTVVSLEGGQAHDERAAEFDQLAPEDTSSPRLTPE
jgi:hypothetical protein